MTDPEIPQPVGPATPATTGKSNRIMANRLYAVALVAHLPMLADWAKNMSQKEHYQFFPLLVAWIVWHGWQAWRSPAQREPKEGYGWAWGLLIADGLVLSLSALAFSPFLVMPALLLWVASAMLARHGRRGWSGALPLALPMAFLIPLPFNWDQRLVTQLQFAASLLASWTLDAIGEMHFRDGVVLATGENRYLAEEACSGIRSLFSSLAAMAVYSLGQGYSLIRYLLNQAQTFIWVIAGNGLRVAMIIVIADNWTPAIAQGWPHEVLGLVVFGGIFLLALSTDQLGPRANLPEAVS